jgi:hypothetical protein
VLFVDLQNYEERCLQNTLRICRADSGISIIVYAINSSALPYSFAFKTAKKASCGISTRPHLFQYSWERDFYVIACSNSLQSSFDSRQHPLDNRHLVTWQDQHG